MAHLKGLRLTFTQKQALVLVASASTPKIAADNVSVGEKMISARDALVKLKFLKFDEDTASLSKKGRDFLKDEGLLDDSGEITDEADKYISTVNNETFAMLRDVLFS